MFYDGKKKGFTLIEILAVIIILAVISFIVTPIISNMIKSIKEKSFVNSAYSILESADNFIVQNMLNNGSNGNYEFSFDEQGQSSNYLNKILDYKGKNPTSGNLVISNDNKIKFAIWFDEIEKCLYKDYEDAEVKINDINKDACYVNSNAVSATWLWINYNDKELEFSYVSDTTKRERIINELYSIGINTIYIPLEPGKINEYKDFISYANSKDIKIYDLIGDPTSIIESNYDKTAPQIIDEIVRFNNDNVDAKIDGIHYDIEFYGLSNDNLGGLGPWINGQSEVAKNGKRRQAYIEFAKKAYAYASNKNIRIEYDITQELSKFTYYDIADNNKEKNMVEELLKYSDSITIMYYVTMEKYVKENNLLTFTGHFDFPHEENSPDSSTEVETSLISYINKYHSSYSVGTELSSFRKDSTKITKCTNQSFINELRPTYIDEKMEYTTSYLKSFYKLQIKELNEYQASNNFFANIGISYHDAWELLYINGYEPTVVENRINVFANELRGNVNCAYED